MRCAQLLIAVVSGYRHLANEVCSEACAEMQGLLEAPLEQAAERPMLSFPLSGKLPLLSVSLFRLLGGLVEANMRWEPGVGRRDVVPSRAGYGGGGLLVGQKSWTACCTSLGSCAHDLPSAT